MAGRRVQRAREQIGEAVTTLRRSDCEVAVIGAGPFGLAAAAHLRSAGIGTRVFGAPMSFWRGNMPKGMFIRSPWDATHIADPNEEYSLDVYAASRGVDRQKQLPIEDFIRYGMWFQKSAVPDLDFRRIARIETMSRGFRLVPDRGEAVYARRVVVATGLANQDFRPAQFLGLPSDLVSHTSDHADFAPFCGRRVAVIGRGQSACESAALLSEAGAEVELICRGEINWLGSETASATQRRDLYWALHKLMATRSGVGPFPFNRLVEFPGLVHWLPDDLRNWFNVRSLRPGATGWLKPRFAGVRVNPGRTVLGARGSDSHVTLDLDNGSSVFDHVVLATGYRIDLARLGILAPDLLARIHCADGSPRLTAGMESSVHGLHFLGSNAVFSFGPLMRFVWGAGYAARSLTRTVLANRGLATPDRTHPNRVGMFNRATDPLLRS